MFKTIFLKFKAKRKGSATVEAVMIFPLIMFILFGIIYLTIIHYQNNVMIAESIRAMNRSGAYWQYIDMNGYGKPLNSGETPLPFDSDVPAEGIIDIDMIRNRNVYRTVIDIVSDVFPDIKGSFFGVVLGIKKDSAKKNVNTRIANIKFRQYKPEEKEAEWAKSNNIIYNVGSMFFGDDLKVEVGRSYINPLQNLSKAFFNEKDYFMKKETIEKKITVSGVISNQAEFIRNLDTVYDIGCNIYEMNKLKKEN